LLLLLSKGIGIISLNVEFYDRNLLHLSMHNLVLHARPSMKNIVLALFLIPQMLFCSPSEPEIKLYDLCPMIMLEDYTIWLLIDDHWIRIHQLEHASWCGCPESNQTK
jgi:hypothetical protein